MASTPCVMVSSTFYDLSQVRADLREFLEDDLGYTPLLSELPSFPVNPDKDTIENCKEKVAQHADLLVLVVGCRYGSIDLKSDKSITNLEYETAQQKGIPIYVFIDKQVLNILPTWKANPEADFSDTVDTPLLFEFVDALRNAEGVWTFPFESAQDIITALRHQFAHLFVQSLSIRDQLSPAGTLPDHLQDIEGEALRIALEEPDGWEYLLYLQCWIDEVEKRRHLVRKFDAGIALGVSEHVPALEAPDWIQVRLHELEQLVEAANHLLNVSTQEAFGEDGVPGDQELIIWTASTIGEIFERALKWTAYVLRAKVEEPFSRVTEEMARFPTQMVRELQEFPRSSLEKTKAALNEVAKGKPQTLELTLTLNLSNQKGFDRAMREAERQFGMR